MKNLKIYFFVIVLLSIVGCDEDQFSSVKNIDFPEHESVLAVTAHVQVSLDSFVVPQAFVSHSLGILDQEDYKLITDATVELYEGTNFIANLENLNNNGHYTGPVAQDFSSGTYTLKVDAPGYDPIEATQTVPSKATPISSTYEFEKIPYDFESELFDLLKLKIADPEGEENYYSFDLIYEVKQNNGVIIDRPGNRYPGSDDPLFEEVYYENSNYEYILPDIAFNGKNHDVRLLQRTDWIVQPDEEIIAVRVLIYTLSKDSYIYEISRSLNYESMDNPFAEPVLVHSNFDGGFGVFTLNNVTSYRHEF